MLLRNVQTPPALLQRIFHQRRLIDLFQLSIGREMPEKNKISSREAFRGRWSSGLSEEKVDVLFRTEGRILAQLVGLAMDQKSAALFCHRTVTSLLLVQNLARWAGTPPSVLAHLLKQAVVRNQPQVRMLILRHPNLPSHARAGRSERDRPAQFLRTSKTRSPSSGSAGSRSGSGQSPGRPRSRSPPASRRATSLLVGVPAEALLAAADDAERDRVALGPRPPRLPLRPADAHLVAEVVRGEDRG